MTSHVMQARECLHRALIAGADARNPRLVALERLIADAEKASPAVPVATSVEQAK